MKEELISAVKTLTAEEIEAERQYILEKIKSIPEEKLIELINAAVAARENAYMPYSYHAVGAAVLCTSGKIYSACNTEVVTYSQTGHAEGNAINKAISEGEGKVRRRFIEAIVCCGPGVSGPCGACRQEIAEHCDNTLYIDVFPSGKTPLVTSLNILFPYAFTPKHLGKD